MNKGMIAAIALLAAGLSGCATSNRSLTKGAIKDVWTAASDADTIRVRGIGSAPDGTKSETQRRGLSREAALVSARREALALLRGVKLTGGVTVEKLMEKDSNIRELANAVILGMEETQTEWTSDSGCVVILELKRSKLERMLSDAGAADASESYKDLQNQASAQVAKLPGVSAQ